MFCSLAPFSVFFSIADENAYHTILKRLSEKWITTELKHRVSKAAAEEFWSVGVQGLHKLHRAKVRERICRPTTGFVSLRKSVYSECVPPIQMQTTYQHKESDEIFTVGPENATLAQFPSTEYNKIMEVASVDVSLFAIDLLSLLLHVKGLISIIFLFLYFR